MTALDAAISQAVRDARSRIDRTVRFVLEHPELAHEEHACSGHLQEVLGDLGLSVETGLAGMPTGFRATLEGGGSGPTVGMVALYDAAPSVPPTGGIHPIHSCGHPQIAGGVMGALAALSTIREALPGRVVVMGCPADEIHAPGTVTFGGGKALSASAGAWDDIDVVLYAHPEPVDTVWTETAWMRRDRALIAGSRTLVDAAPQPVLDAVRRAVDIAAAYPRAQVMLEQLSLDGDVEEGGGLVLKARFLLWAPDGSGLDALAERLRTALPAVWTAGPVVPGIRSDPVVRALVLDALRAAGRVPVEDPGPLPFATDFGAIAQRRPAALIGVGHPDGWAFHTPRGAEEFASPAGFEAASGIAQVLALAALRLVAPSLDG